MPSLLRCWETLSLCVDPVLLDIPEVWKQWFTDKIWFRVMLPGSFSDVKGSSCKYICESHVMCPRWIIMEAEIEYDVKVIDESTLSQQHHPFNDDTLSFHGHVNPWEKRCNTSSTDVLMILQGSQNLRTLLLHANGFGVIERFIFVSQMSLGEWKTQKTKALRSADFISISIWNGEVLLSRTQGKPSITMLFCWRKFSRADQ